MADKQIKDRKTQRPKVEPRVQERLRGMAAELRHMIYGEKGCPEWGTLFRDIERDGMSVGLELARLLMEQTTSVQVDHLPNDAMQVPGDVVQPAGTDQARLETPPGDITWEEPCGHLQKSRKAFLARDESFPVDQVTSRETSDLLTFSEKTSEESTGAGR